jgi:hypothetical protein
MYGSYITPEAIELFTNLTSDMAKPVLLEIILNLYLKGQKPNPICLKLNVVALSNFVSFNTVLPPPPSLDGTSHILHRSLKSEYLNRIGYNDFNNLVAPGQ